MPPCRRRKCPVDFSEQVHHNDVVWPEHGFILHRLADIGPRGHELNGESPLYQSLARVQSLPVACELVGEALCVTAP
jgi:hypothetical protein